MLCQTCLDIVQRGRNLFEIKADPKCPVASRELHFSGAEGKVECRIMHPTNTLHGHHQSMLSFENAVQGGCFICSHIWNELSEAQQRTLYDIEASWVKKTAVSRTPRFLNWLEFGANPTYFRLEVYILEPLEPTSYLTSFDLRPKSSQCTRFMLGEMQTIQNTAEQIRSPSVTSDCTASLESLGVAKGWLEWCTSSHGVCIRGSATTPWFPTRLLDLGELQQNSESIRLVHTAEHKINGPYMTLSHRWGGAEFLKLTEASIDRLCSAFPVLELPRTFQEAITVSRALQVRYLWIGSLCIRQDMLSDWAFEAKQMDMVYSNSYCNISASHARDSSEGLFRHRAPHLLQETEVELCLDTQCKLQNAHHNYVVLNNNLFLGLIDCELNKRGWVFQERVLAPRVLHFCREQLFWECHSEVLCEQYTHGTLSDISNNSSMLQVKQNRAYFGQDVDSWYDFWDHLVGEYSRTSLTYPSDKLIALSGVAKMVRLEIDDTYIAGMWLKGLPKQLLWLRLGESTRAHVYRAPSWSWACVEGCVFSFAAHSATEAQGDWAITVEDVHIDYTTDDDTGQIHGGWLDLKGPVKPVSLVWTDDISRADRTEWSVITSGGSTRDVTEKHVHLDDTSIVKETILQRSAAKAYFCMLCHKSDSANGQVSCLLLQLIDAERALYERVGFSWSFGDYLAESVGEASEEERRSIPSLRYEDGKHTVRII